jgi:hypothetical protein
MATFQLALPEFVDSYHENNLPSPPVLSRQSCWDSARSEDSLSPPLLLRQNCNSEFCPPLEQQLSKIYKLNTGNVYSFKENYSLSSKDRIEYSVLITGTFLRYKNLKAFEFIVDGAVVEFSYRNFSILFKFFFMIYLFNIFKIKIANNFLKYFLIPCFAE